MLFSILPTYASAEAAVIDASSFSGSAFLFTDNADGSVTATSSDYQPHFYFTQEAIDRIKAYAAENNRDVLCITATYTGTNLLLLNKTCYIGQDPVSYNVRVADLTTSFDFWSQSEGATSITMWFSFPELSLIHAGSFAGAAGSGYQFSDYSGEIAGVGFNGIKASSNNYQPAFFFTDEAVANIKSYANQFEFNALRMHIYGTSNNGQPSINGEWMPPDEWLQIDVAVSELSTGFRFWTSCDQGGTIFYLWFEFMNLSDITTDPTEKFGTSDYPIKVVAQAAAPDMDYFPDVVLIPQEKLPSDVQTDYPNGKLLVAFYQNDAHAPQFSGKGSLGKIRIVESKDNGLTWSEPKDIVTPEYLLACGVATESAPLEARDPNFALLNDGTVVLTFFTYPDPLDTHIIFSRDGGETWSNPTKIPTAYLDSYCAKRGDIAVFEDDQLLIPLYGEGTPVLGETATCVLATLNSNGAWTWGNEYLIAESGKYGSTVNEVSLVATATGDTVYAMAREPGTVWQSDNRGATWTVIGQEICENNGKMHQPGLKLLPDGSILATWSVQGAAHGGRPIFVKRFYPELGWDATEAKLVYWTSLTGDMGDPSGCILSNGQLFIPFYDTNTRCILAAFVDPESLAPAEGSVIDVHSFYGATGSGYSFADFSGEIDGVTFDGVMASSFRYQPSYYFFEEAIEEIKTYAAANGYDILRMHIYTQQSSGIANINGEWEPANTWFAYDVSIKDLTPDFRFWTTCEKGTTTSYMWFEFLSSHTHFLTPVAERAATCLESGNIAYYTCECGKWFSDAEGQNLISDHNSVIVSALGHDIVADAPAAPDCTNSGLTAGEHCTRCDYTVAQEVVSALGHDFADGICIRCGEADPNYQPPDPCDGYSDINRTSWYHSAADFVIARGLMGSTKTDTLVFEPNTKVSRAMVASILYRMAGSPAADYKATFTDVPEGKWFTTAIEWCAQNGLASGKGDSKFDPNGNVTRQELAVFMMKMTQYLEKSTEGRNELSSFADANKVPTWALDYVRWAVDAGLISGKSSDGKTLLAPADNATRAEFASVIMRFVQNIAEAE